MDSKHFHQLVSPSSTHHLKLGDPSSADDGNGVFLPSQETEMLIRRLGGRLFPPPLPIQTEQDSSTAKPLNKGHLGGIESGFIQRHRTGVGQNQYVIGGVL